jgi:hypothetical protein
LVAGVTDTSTAKWEKLIGRIEVLPIVFNPRCNWRVRIERAGADREVVEKAVEILRDAHPYVLAERSPDG